MFRGRVHGYKEVEVTVLKPDSKEVEDGPTNVIGKLRKVRRKGDIIGKVT